MSSVPTVLAGTKHFANFNAQVTVYVQPCSYRTMQAFNRLAPNIYTTGTSSSVPMPSLQHTSWSPDRVAGIAVILLGAKPTERDNFGCCFRSKTRTGT